MSPLPDQPSEGSSNINDYDILDDVFIDDPHQVYRQIRGSSCPIAHTEKHGGSWLPVNYDDVVSISQDPKIFSSRVVLLPRSSIWENDPYEGVLPTPISIDPPEHGYYRELLQPYFSSQSLAKLSPLIEQTCEHLVKIIAGQDVVDIVPAYAQQIQAAVVCALLGIPQDMRVQLATLAWKIQASSIVAQAESDQAEIYLLDYLDCLIKERRAGRG